MKVRRLDRDGDYQFGRGAVNFLQDVPEAVGQNVQTRLALWQGQWFLDTSSGMPWEGGVLGVRKAYEPIIRDRILETVGVKELDELEFVLDSDERSLSVTATISTDYGTASVGGD